LAEDGCLLKAMGGFGSNYQGGDYGATVSCHSGLNVL